MMERKAGGDVAFPACGRCRRIAGGDVAGVAILRETESQVPRMTGRTRPSGKYRVTTHAVRGARKRLSRPYLESEDRDQDSEQKNR